MSKPLFERGHYDKLAEFWKDQLSTFGYDAVERDRIYREFVAMLKTTNSNFNEDRFNAASGYTK